MIQKNCVDIAAFVNISTEGIETQKIKECIELLAGECFEYIFVVVPKNDAEAIRIVKAVHECTGDGDRYNNTDTIVYIIQQHKTALEYINICEAYRRKDKNNPINQYIFMVL